VKEPGADAPARHLQPVLRQRLACRPWNWKENTVRIVHGEFQATGFPAQGFRSLPLVQVTVCSNWSPKISLHDAGPGPQRLAAFILDLHADASRCRGGVVSARAGSRGSSRGA